MSRQREREKRDPQEIALEAAKLLVAQPTAALITALVSLAEWVALLSDRELAQQSRDSLGREGEYPHKTELREELESASKPLTYSPDFLCDGLSWRAR